MLCPESLVKHFIVALETFAGRFLNAAAKTTPPTGPTNVFGLAVKMQDGAAIDGEGDGLGEGVGVCVAVGVGVRVAVGVGVSDAAALGSALATKGVGEAGHCFSCTHPTKISENTTNEKQAIEATVKRFK